MKTDQHFCDLLGTNLKVLQSNPLFSFYANNLPIHQIGKEYYLTNKQMGIGFVFNEAHVLEAIHLYGAENDGIKTFSGMLPFNLLFGDNKINSHTKLGSSEFEQGGGEVLPILGKMDPWRKYDLKGYYLHLRFNQDDSITLVTIGLLEPT